ncbi:MAG: low-specificity L-threonine aldolase [Nitrospinaceae bacterium]|nr:low-specificity L-threonine aldolase [Nitrospinaceae bacterium]NIR56510.1 low-specificity L-threonine aldolase [Nitrospinaceae bacterium]NIS86968.1 low-specificity L-threonine aldolase [Nitrospinaceae bacterium]NIT83812.1 low-specificity L-threonine aldolase [Nitrospinaceae bacterium]NIU46018.1 low-specificity L-threonine aldolase [Nitrospinaceae bacterium]
MEIIDLRSDTMTQPTETMREAMAKAEVGDDVFDEDPTIHRLQDLAAETMGKQAALFLPSGTMGNLVSLLTHCQRGEEVLLGDMSHIFLNEVGGLAALGGIHPRTIPNREDGTLPLDELEKAIRPQDLHYPPTRLICLENTQNYCFGSPLSPPYMDSVADLARRYGLKLHIDGARIFNAAVALSVDVQEITRQADSVMFSLSKGLSAPVGSIISGDREWIEKARKWRKMLGGGMRQAGHLAAAGVVALEEMVERLKEDHQNARDLAQGLKRMTGIRIDPEKNRTNILFFELDHPEVSPEAFLQKAEDRGIKMLLMEGGLFRAVLNRMVKREHVPVVLKFAEEILGKDGDQKV